jgi:peptidyl-prolyl cis-trans isomerase SurA
LKRSTIAIALALAIGGASVRARAEVVERVVAVVNDEAIFLSELRRRASPFLSRAMAAPTEAQRMAAIEQLYTQLLERMVEEELFIQAADDMDVSVTRAEVDRAIENVRRQSGLAEEDFWAAVRQQGFTPEQYRADVRRQLLRLKVINNRARGRVNITEDQVRAQYQQTVAQARRTSRFNADHIFFQLGPNPSASQVADARRAADEVRDRIENAGDFETEQANHPGSGTLGWLSEGTLPEALEDELMNLDEGEIGQPVRGPAGFHIFLVRERQTGSAEVPTYEAQRMEIYQRMMAEAMASQEQIFLAELRRAATIDVRL